MTETVSFTLNGRPVSLDTDPARTLLWVLRTDLELTGTKYGCGEADPRPSWIPVSEEPLHLVGDVHDFSFPACFDGQALHDTPEHSRTRLQIE